MKRTRVVYLLIIAFLLCCSAALLLRLHRSSGDPSGEETVAHRSEKCEKRVASDSCASPATAVPLSVRAEIRRRIRENAERLNTPASVDAYLEDMKAQARAKGAVTALEVQPGVEALESLTEQLDETEIIRRSEAFLDEMKELSRELRGETNAPVAAPNFDRLLDAVEQAAEPAARQIAIGAYLAAAEQLPDESQEEALNRLRPFSSADKSQEIATTE